MTATSLPCFHRSTLRATFFRHLAQTINEKRLPPEQATLLQTLCDVPWAPASDLRLDTLESPGIDHPELADAVLVSSRTQAFAEVVLCSPITGIETFDNRSALHSKLQERYASGRQTLDVEASLLQGSMFEYWMQRALERLDAQALLLDGQLERLPTLPSIVAERITAALAGAVERTDVDIDQWVYQVIAAPPADVSATPLVLATRTLLDVALDRCCAVPLPAGQALRLIDEHGLALPAEQAGRVETALSEAVAQLSSSYERALDRYWLDPAPGRGSRRAATTQTLCQRFYQTLMQAAASQSIPLQDLRKLCQVMHPGRADAGGSYVNVERIVLYSANGAALKLAGVLAISFGIPVQPGLYVYSPQAGLLQAGSQAKLGAFLTARPASLQAAIALEDGATFATLQSPPAALADVVGDVFAHAMDAARTLQKRNLAYTLAQPRLRPERLAAQLDDAMDIRGQLLPGLLRLDGSLRCKPAPAAQGTRVNHVAMLPTGSERLAAWRSNLAYAQQRRADIETCALHLLDLQLQGFGAAAPMSRQLRLASPAWALAGGQARQPLPLVDVLFEQLAGNLPASLPEEVAISDERGIGLASIDRPLLERILKLARERLPAYWDQTFKACVSGPIRVGDEQLDARRIGAQVRQALYREEIALAAATAGSSGKPWMADWLHQVLDLPCAAMREHLHEARVEVRRIAIEGADAGAPIVLSNMAILTLAAAPEGSVLLCSHLYGVGDYPRLSDMSRELDALLRNPLRTLHSLKLVAETDQPRLLSWLRASPQAPLRFSFRPVAIGLCDYTQDSEVRRQCLSATAHLVHAQAAGMFAATFKAYVSQAASADRLALQLDELAFNLHSSELDQQLPEWVVRASSAELQHYLKHLGRLFTALQAKRNFLFDIPSLQQYARRQVLGHLSRDYPELDIDLIRVKAVRHTSTGAHWSAGTAGMVPWGAAATSELLEMSLLDYCIHRAITLPEKHLELRQSTGEPLPPSFNSRYVKDLATTVDVGSHYLTILNKRFHLEGLDDSHEHPGDYENRRALFQQQIAPLVIQSALQANLQGQLTKTNLLSVEAIMNMPDAIARLPVEGASIQLWPLELRAAPSLPLDPVAGVYLLGPAPSEGKSLVLLATFNEAFTLRQFKDEAELKRLMHQDAELSRLILSRVAPAVHGRYANGGLEFPNFAVPAGPDPTFPISRPRTALGFNPVTGNALTYLFEQALAFLLRLTKADVVTNNQADLAANQYLITLLRDTSLALAGGRLSWVVAAWQSGEWLKGSAGSLAAGNRSEALSQTTAAITTLLTHRRPRLERLEPKAARAPVSSFGFERHKFPEALRGELRKLEARNVQLRNLSKDAARNLYVDQVEKRTFAAIDGNVYEVRQRADTWEICSGEQVGPQVRRDVEGDWELDTAWLRGGGPGYSRQRASGGDWNEGNIAGHFSITAAGMAAIRRSDLRRAIDIREAHDYALLQLRKSRKALKPVAASGLPAEATLNIVNPYFGCATPHFRIIEAVRNRVDRLLLEFSKRSLQRESKRYVMGHMLKHPDTGVATTFIGDPQRRLFLGERFFEVPPEWQTPPLLPQFQFQGTYAFRSATLIHEVTHQLFNTEDILYLWPHSPMREMIDTSTPRGARMLARLDLQRVGLSHLTPRAKLFTHQGRGNRSYVQGDLQYAAILEETGANTLDAAKTLFLNDDWLRAKVMLRNADSLTLLIKLLAGPLP